MALRFLDRCVRVRMPLGLAALGLEEAAAALRVLPRIDARTALPALVARLNTTWPAMPPSSELRWLSQGVIAAIEPPPRPDLGIGAVSLATLLVAFLVGVGPVERALQLREVQGLGAQ